MMTGLSTEKKLRICLVADGRSEHTLRLARFLMEGGHEVHLVCWKKNKIMPEKLHLHFLKTLKIPLIRELFWLIQTRIRIRSIKPDIVDGHYINVYGFAAALSGFHPLMITAWGSDILIHPFRNRLYSMTAKYAISRADTIACLFDFKVAEDKLHRLGADLSRFVTYYLGVDTEKFQPHSENGKTRYAFGLSQTGPVVLYTRGLAPVYDVETLLKAIPIVLNAIPQTQFVILYKPDNQKQADEIRQRSTTFERVKFIPFIPRDRMPELISAADIYVSTSLSDGASNALFEAMACQVAPVVTDIPANRVWIKEGENGYLFNIKDYQALADKIIYLVKNPEIRILFGCKCRQDAVQFFDQKTQLSRIIGIYEKLVTGNIKTK